MQIRKFISEDAESLSQLITRNLWTVIINEYTKEAVEALVKFFTPQNLINDSNKEYMIVCILDEKVVVSASLDGNSIRNVFVEVDLHGAGIGKLLKSGIEKHAVRQKHTSVHLYSSLNAEGFYRKLGYRSINRHERFLEGNLITTIKMEKELLDKV